MDEASVDLFSSDPDTRARAFIDRGLSKVEVGEHDSAMADLNEGKRIAEQAGIVELVAASLINQGYAQGVHGDRSAAIDHYAQAADVAREAADHERLRLALTNLGLELKQESRHAEAIGALGELFELLDESEVDARARVLMERGLSHLEVDDQKAALDDLEEAGRIAAEADDRELMYLARMNEGYVYTRMEDPSSARILLEQAVDLARKSDGVGLLRDALRDLAQVNRILGNSQQADTQFTEVEELCRSTGDKAALADALYWHGVLFRSIGRSQQALKKWREEEPIRRELGQDGYLADCLHAQADALRRRNAHEAADPLYAEATAIYRRLDVTHVLPTVLYWHGMSLWTGMRPEEAIVRADEAFAAATEEGDTDIQTRAHGLRAIALADLGDAEAAEKALDDAEALCEETEAHILMVWMIARRAYVLARVGRPAEDVTEQLKRAYLYDFEHGDTGAGRSAARKIMAHIIARCSDEYQDPLISFKNQFLAEPDAEIDAGPPGVLPAGLAPSGAEAGDASSPEEDEQHEDEDQDQ